MLLNLRSERKRAGNAGLSEGAVGSEQLDSVRFATAPPNATVNGIDNGIETMFSETRARFGSQA